MSNSVMNEILKDARVTAIGDILDRHDRMAGEAQKAFKNFSYVFIAGTMIAALAAALLLFGSGVADAENPHPLAALMAGQQIQTLLFAIEVGALAIAAFAAHVQESRQHISRWSSERKKAEEARIEMAETIFAIAMDADTDKKLAAFDHFVADHLDGQIDYFAKRQAQHDKRASRFAIYGAVVAFFVAVAGVSGYSDAWLPVAALLGVLAPILMTALNSWRDTGNDGDKAARYSDVWVQLRRLKGQSEETKKQLAGGDDKAGAAYVAAVNAVLRDELSNWTSGQDAQIKAQSASGSVNE